MAKGCSPNNPCLPASMWAKQMMYPSNFSNAPSTQASNIVILPLSTTSALISWTNGNGNGRIVAISPSTITEPSNGVTYSASSVYGSGDALGSGYVVYNGDSYAVEVTGLTAGTDYNVKVFEANDQDYNVSDATNNPNTWYQPADYTSNLLYDFVFTQGFVADANNLDYDSITDLVSGLVITPTQTNEDLASNSILQLTTEGQGFTISNSNPGVNATNVTFVFCLAADAPHAETNGIILFDNLTPAPRVILQFETSNVSSVSRVQWNGVEKSFGASFTFDNVFRALAYRFSGTDGQMYVSGSQVGTVSGLTGGQFAMNTSSTTRRFLRGASTIMRTFKKRVKRIRVYREAVSPSNISLISDTRNVFMNAYPVRKVIIVRWKGQSLAEGGPGSWNVGTMPAELTGNIPRCYKWDNNARVLDPLNATDDTLLSPRMSFSYALSQEYPDHDIINIVGAVGGTNMDSWTPPGGARYTNAKTWDANLLAHLTTQGRQISHEILWWNQGQTDSQNATLSQTAVYGPKELSFFNQEITDNNPDLILTARMRTDLPAPTTVTNVNNINAAKNSNAAQFSNCIIYDDTYEISGDNTHHTQQGQIDYGYGTATLAINYINSLAV